MKKIGIIGYGRFGKVLVDLLSGKYEIMINDIVGQSKTSMIFYNLEEVLKCEIVFIAVPIRSFEGLLKEICKYNLHNTTIVDVCSVKVYPVELMQKYLPKDVGIIASHPHFGPDSYSPFKELKATVYPVRDIFKHFDEVKDFFESKSIRVVSISPDEHDRMAAASQGITHFIGRVLDETGIRSTQINTFGFNELLGVVEQTCNDSWDLFKDLQKFNPYTKPMIDKLINKIDILYKEIKEDGY